MERNLGLCEGCTVWTDYSNDYINGKFNDKCRDVMLQWYRDNRPRFYQEESYYKEQCISNIKNVYSAARELKTCNIDDCLSDDSMGTNEREKKYYIIKSRNLYFEKEDQKVEMRSSMLYQLLMNLDNDCGIDNELRIYICQRLKEDFCNKDNHFFNKLDKVLHIIEEPERLKECLNKILCERDENGDLLFKNKSLWCVIFRVCRENCLVPNNLTKFVRYVNELGLSYVNKE